jgi:peptide/nickel transport system permease protein
MRTASVAGRIGRMLLQALGIIVFVFVAVRVVPGDAVDVLAVQGDLTEAQEAAKRQELGLDRPLVAQFLDWAGGAIEGDFGQSMRFGRPVADMLLAALPTTLTFSALSFAVGLALSFGLAIAAALWPGRLTEGAVELVNVWSIALPTFCVGVIGILIFSIWLGWLPVIGGLLLPVVIIGIDNAGQIVKTLAEELREAATAAHVRTARAKGLSPLRVVVLHLLPTAVPVALALAGLVLAGLISGTITMEVLFGLPGLGSLIVNAIHGRDYPVIQAAMAVVALSLVVINAAADILLRLVDPRPAR